MSRDYEPEENLHGVEIENSYLRRLLQILRLPNTDLKKRKDEDEEENEVVSTFKKCWACFINFLQGK